MVLKNIMGIASTFNKAKKVKNAIGTLGNAYVSQRNEDEEDKTPEQSLPKQTNPVNKTPQSSNSSGISDYDKGLLGYLTSFGQNGKNVEEQKNINTQRARNKQQMANSNPIRDLVVGAGNYVKGKAIEAGVNTASFLDNIKNTPIPEEKKQKKEEDDIDKLAYPSANPNKIPKTSKTGFTSAQNNSGGRGKKKISQSDYLKKLQKGELNALDIGAYDIIPNKTNSSSKAGKSGNGLATEQTEVKKLTMQSEDNAKQSSEEANDEFNYNDSEGLNNQEKETHENNNSESKKQIIKNQGYLNQLFKSYNQLNNEFEDLNEQFEKTIDKKEKETLSEELYFIYQELSELSEEIAKLIGNRE